jgi:hypothetical protein
MVVGGLCCRNRQGFMNKRPWRGDWGFRPSRAPESNPARVQRMRPAREASGFLQDSFTKFYIQGCCRQGAFRPTWPGIRRSQLVRQILRDEGIAQPNDRSAVAAAVRSLIALALTASRLSFCPGSNLALIVGVHPILLCGSGAVRSVTKPSVGVPYSGRGRR